MAFPTTMKPETIARRIAERKAEETERRACFVANFMAAKAEIGFPAELPEAGVTGWFAIPGREEEVLVTPNGFRVI